MCGRDSKGNMALETCFGPIGRLCFKNQALVPIVLDMRVFWDDFFANDEVQPGLQSILFALEHINNKNSHAVNVLCRPLWCVMLLYRDLACFLKDHIIDLMCKNITFESRVLLATVIMNAFETSYQFACEREQKSITLENLEQPCNIENCVCCKERNVEKHVCSVQCQLINELLTKNDIQEDIEKKQAKRLRHK